MASFTKKVFGLAGIATAFAGMAFGQASCSTPVATGASLIRAEGTTEQVAPLTITCTAGSSGAAAGPVSINYYINPTTITSRVTSTTTNATEAVISAVTNNGTPVTASGTLVGTTQLNFSVTVGTLAPGETYVFTISNVRVNATTLALGAGAPPPVTASAFINGASVTAASLQATSVAFVSPGITSKLQKTFSSAGFPYGTTSGTTANNFVICNATSPASESYTGATSTSPKSLAFSVVVSEVFQGAFKTATNNANQNSAVPTTPAATSDRIAVNFTNVPTGVTLYIPSGTISSQTTSNGATIRGVTTATGGTFLTQSTASGVAGLAVAPAGSTAYFSVETDNPFTTDSFVIPVFVVFASNAVPISSTGIGVTVSFAPVGSTNIPNFVVGSSTTQLTGSVFNACTTSLLFPFVTNAAGFDTGIAISNTSSDPFGTTLGATPQAGTCTMSFYGDNAPATAFTTPAAVASGKTYTAVLSNVASAFQGYIIAQCNFQYAHGFAFITNGVGANGGLSQGYLAGVIPDVNQTGGRPASDPSKSIAGAGETLGN